MASTAHKVERYSPYKIPAVKQEWIEQAEQNKPDIIVIEAEVVKQKRIKRKRIKPEQNKPKPIIIDVESEQLVRLKPKRIKSELQEEPEMIVIEPKLVNPEQMKPKQLQDEPEMIVIEPKLVNPEQMKPKRIKSELHDEPEMIVIKSELVKPKPKRFKPERIKTERIKPKSERIKYKQPTQGMLNARPIFFQYHSETAGPDLYRDQIVQIAVTMLGDEPESFSSLIKPTHQEISMWGNVTDDGVAPPGDPPADLGDQKTKQQSKRTVPEYRLIQCYRQEGGWCHTRKSVRVEVLEEQKRKRKRENDKIAANTNVKRKPNCKYHSEDYKKAVKLLYHKERRYTCPDCAEWYGDDNRRVQFSSRHRYRCETEEELRSWDIAFSSNTDQ